MPKFQEVESTLGSNLQGNLKGTRDQMNTKAPKKLDRQITFAWERAREYGYENGSAGNHFVLAIKWVEVARGLEMFKAGRDGSGLITLARKSGAALKSAFYRDMVGPGHPSSVERKAAFLLASLLQDHETEYLGSPDRQVFTRGFGLSAEAFARWEIDGYNGRYGIQINLFVKNLDEWEIEIFTYRRLHLSIDPHYLLRAHGKISRSDMQNLKTIITTILRAHS